MLYIELRVLLDVVPDSLCAVFFKEPTSIIFLVHLQQIFVRVFEVVVAIIAFVIHSDTGTVAIMVGLTVRSDITHKEPTLSAFLRSLTFFFLMAHNLMYIISPQFLLADGRYAIPPITLMFTIPPIDYQAIILTLRVWKHL